MSLRRTLLATLGLTYLTTTWYEHPCLETTVLGCVSCGLLVTEELSDWTPFLGSLWKTKEGPTVVERLPCSLFVREDNAVYGSLRVINRVFWANAVGPIGNCGGCLVAPSRLMLGSL